MFHKPIADLRSGAFGADPRQARFFLLIQPSFSQRGKGQEILRQIKNLNAALAQFSVESSQSPQCAPRVFTRTAQGQRINQRFRRDRHNEKLNIQIGELPIKIINRFQRVAMGRIPRCASVQRRFAPEHALRQKTQFFNWIRPAILA